MPARKMLLSSRAAPPKYLTVPSKSSLSVREVLLHSPLPSPSLPAILPRHGKKPPPINTRKVLRVLCWLVIFTGLYTLYTRTTKKASKNTPNPIYEHPDGHAYQYVEEFDLPDYASPLAVTDHAGNSRWTIHIPAKFGFPLESSTYADICSHVNEVSTYVAKSRKNEKEMKNLKFYEPDTNYIDVAQAQLSDLLPFDPTFSPSGELPLCKSTMIYVLDSSDAGLGSSLMGLWLAYGLAQHEKKAFFIDDSHFSYGKYSSLFTAPPSPNCRPPPTTHRVSCPHLSQHLVVTASTWQWTFGDSFHKQFDEKHIFEMMRNGYEALFKLLPEDKAYVDTRIAELKKEVGLGGILTGVHIRRGDKHPEEFQYRHGYIPPTEYTSALKKMTSEAKNHLMVLASDDADMYHDTEFEDAQRAQEKIQLASKKQLGESGGLGWERGFFKEAFWNLGVPEDQRKKKNSASPAPTKEAAWYNSKEKSGEPDRDYRTDPTPEALQLRAYIGRAYLLDLAVLARSDRLVCTVSSRGCRILGVMMGWDKVEMGHWKNIDGSAGWKGLR